MKINSFLILKLNKTSTEVKEFIHKKMVLIDGIPAIQKQKITYKNAIDFNNIQLQLKTGLFYFAYNKPRGIESTMNKNIENNLYEATGIKVKFFPVGRLDKDSEGLMILSNSGEFYNKIISPIEKVEKEYLVTVNKVLTEEFILQLKSGVVIMGKKTKECAVEIIDEFTFRIVLIEGKNRQIRRMCYKIGLDVLKLKRIRIGKLILCNLSFGELLKIEKSDI